ncbi:MAG: MarR family transcriptional regulator [Flavobacteriales bacterium]|nr:MarR family transcriptional regulator [Flavobacteriales bacterium]MCB9193781.1 MarR family transcriptional regulator [Flavobacteriales bacterium]
MSDLGSVVFYTIERAIKTYRQFAQRRLVAAGSTLTVDQWLVLNVLEEEPGIQQGLVAELVFKDKASIARMVDLLVRTELVERKVPASDRRSVSLRLTRKGKRELVGITPVVEDYRKRALKGVKAGDIVALQGTLNRIMANCDE